MKTLSWVVLILTGLLTVYAQGVATWKPRIIVMDNRLNAIVAADSALEKLADGFTWAEGPVWNSFNKSLLFSDVPNNRIHQWKNGRPVSVFMERSGYSGQEIFNGKEPGSNGLTLDAQGRLIFCQHGDRRISRLEKDGTRTTLVDRYMGKRLNSPNDLVLRSNGDLYFTDPPFGLPATFDDPNKELEYQGIYRLGSNGTLNLLNAEFKGPNGIAFSPDEKRLYVSDPILSAWYAFDVQGDGMLKNKRMLLDGTKLKRNGPGGPDGMKVDIAGNIFSAGPGGLYIITPEGSILGRFDFGVAVGNCAWGEDGNTLFITANTALFRIKLQTKGAKF